ncbi:MAG: hypothetical protein ACRDXX_11350, partial [Stackebrandtia sp.]
QSEPSRVVVVGVPGLLWADLDAENTPALWALMGESGAASMSVRTIDTISCADPSWASMGAGRRTGSHYPQGDVCPPGSLVGPPQQQADGSWTLPGQAEIAEANDATASAYRPKPGLLAETVGCAAAVGPGASVAAAHPDGTVDRYTSSTPESPEDFDEFTADCPVAFVDPQTPVYGSDADRAAAAAEADAVVADVMSVVSDDDVVVVAGISDVTAPANLHPVMVRADGWADQWLTSAATRRDGYVQILDVAATAVNMSGHSADGAGMTGYAMRPSAPREGDVADTVAEGVDANLAGQQVPPMSDSFYATLTIAGLILIAAAIALCRRRLGERRSRVGRLLVAPALIVASIPVASMLVNTVAWWRASNPGLTLWLTMTGFAVLVAAVAYLGPWRRWVLGPPAVVAIVTAAVFGIDSVIGTPLQFNSLTGYSAIVGARFTGMGNYGFGAFAAGAIMAVLYATVRMRPARATIVIAVVGAACVLVIGAPTWGNDVGGVITLAPAFVLVGLHAAGKRLSTAKIVASLAVGALAISSLMIVDYMRPPDRQTHLGRFVGEVLDGSAVSTLVRKGTAALNTISSGPLTLLVIGACVAVPLLWHTTLVRGLIERYPAVLSAGIGVAAVSLLGFASNDSGIAVSAFTMTVAAPLFVATAALYAGYGPETAPPQTTSTRTQKNSSSSR